MTARYGEEGRLGIQTIWSHSAFFRSELADYVSLDAALETGTGCAVCGKTLRYPLIEVTLGGSDLLLHPDCGDDLGRSLIEDVGAIERTVRR